jgi:hypothetical protein
VTPTEVSLSSLSNPLDHWRSFEKETRFVDEEKENRLKKLKLIRFN